MFKKVFGIVAALTFIFGLATQSELRAKISEPFACDYCEHNGDIWSW